MADVGQYIIDNATTDVSVPILCLREHIDFLQGLVKEGNAAYEAKIRQQTEEIAAIRAMAARWVEYAQDLRVALQDALTTGLCSEEPTDKDKEHWAELISRKISNDGPILRGMGEKGDAKLEGWTRESPNDSATG